MPGRRLLSLIPQLTRRAWEDVAPELERFLTRLWDAQGNGLPAGAGTTTASIILAGSIGDAGNPTTGWSPADHDHPVVTGAPSGLANTTQEGTSTAIPRLDHKHKRDVRVKKAGADLATRNAVDLQDTPSITWADSADDAGNDEVDIKARLLPWQNFVATSAATYTVLATDFVLLADSTGANVVVNLPAASAKVGRTLTVKKKVAANQVKLHPNGTDKIEGVAADFVLAAALAVVQLISDGTDWWLTSTA